MKMTSIYAGMFLATLPVAAMADAAYTLTDAQDGGRGKLVYEKDIGPDALFIHTLLNDRIYVEGYANSGPNQNRFRGYYVTSDAQAPQCSTGPAKDHEGNIWGKWGYLVFNASPDRNQIAIEFQHCGTGNIITLYGAPAP